MCVWGLSLYVCGGVRVAKELNKNGYTQKQQHLSTIYMVYYIVT